MLLSIIIPVFNEVNYIYDVLEKIKQIELVNNISKQLIIINDGSIDGTDKKINDFLAINNKINVKYIKLAINAGKGNAIKEAFAFVKGDLIIIHDGDLEYDPNNWNILLDTFIKNNADVVTGNRFNQLNPLVKNKYYYGNKGITFLFNLFSGTTFNDVETCSKLFSSAVAAKLQIREKRFGFEIEFMRKIVRSKGIKILEADINYNPRKRSEGKKINILDGFRAIYCILKY